jgi:hypothetical protein
MKSMVSGTILAAVLFVVAAACWSEAQVTRRVANAHRRLATLHYDAEDDIDGAVTVFNRLPWPGGEGTVRCPPAIAPPSRTGWSATTRWPRFRWPPDRRPVTIRRCCWSRQRGRSRNSAPQVGDRKAAVERLTP